MDSDTSAIICSLMAMMCSEMNTVADMFRRRADPDPFVCYDAAHFTSLNATKIEKVTGIGGLFSRWRNPDARRYHENLGVTITPKSSDEMPWQQEAGPSGLSPLPDAT